MINLLNNRADAFAALDLLEGEGWCAAQLASESDSEYGLARIMERLMGDPRYCSQGIAFATLYGSGGWRRYLVYVTGEVKFSWHHRQWNDQREDIKSLGFAIV